MLAARPGDIVAELTASLDVVVQIAAADRCELLRAGLNAGEIEIDGSEAQYRPREKGKVVLLGKGDALLTRTGEAAVMTNQTEAHLVDQVGSDDVHIGQRQLHGVIHGRRAAAEKTWKDADGRFAVVALREAAVQSVLRGDGVVNADITLIGIRKLRRLVEIITRQIARVAKVWKRNQADDCQRGLVQHRGGDLVARELGRNYVPIRTNVACRRIINLDGTARKFAGPECHWGKIRNRAARSGTLPRALIVNEEEQFVLEDRAAQCCAELVLVERWAWQAGQIGEVIVRVEDIVTQEFEDDTMELICAILERGIDDRTGCMAELGWEVVGLYFELLDSVHRRNNCNTGASDVSYVRDRIVIDTVERDVDRGEAAATRDKWKVGLHTEEGRRVTYQQAQRVRITAIQWAC